MWLGSRAPGCESIHIGTGRSRRTLTLSTQFIVEIQALADNAALYTNVDWIAFDDAVAVAEDGIHSGNIFPAKARPRQSLNRRYLLRS